MTCPCCGHDRASLLDLPRIGTQSDGGEVLLLVNEPCGTTRAVVLVPHPEDVRARFESAYPEAS